MTSVTQRISEIKQPRGGYTNPRAMTVTRLDDGLPSPLDHKIENVHAAIIGIMVDYMSRFLNGAPAHEAFGISLLGASLIGESAHAADLLHGVASLNHASIASACQLAGYDVVFRKGEAWYVPVESINPDATTTAHIAAMLERSLSFFEGYGPVTQDGFTFLGGYTETVSSGDGDFLTADTLWDFKVSVASPTKNHTLQLLMYYLMGKRSGQQEFRGITHLGVFNPRLNTVYRIAVADITPEVIDEVSREVIGYK